MKKYLLTSIIVAIGFTQVFTQIFEKHTELSVFSGIQNPIENALLDIWVRGNKESFDPGTLVGVGIKQKARRFSMGLRGTYMYNSLKNFSDVEQNSDLHNFSMRGDFWFNILDPDSKFRLELGAGLGAVFFKHPGSTSIWIGDSLDPGWTYIEEAYISQTTMVNSGINFYYNLNRCLDLFAAIGNDIIFLYGDEESAIQSSISIGVAYKL